MSTQVIILLVLMAGMMFLTSRSQKKQQERQQNMLNSIKAGDEVVTIGGLFGLVDSLDTEAKTITLDIDGIYLTFELGAIKKVTTKAETESSDSVTSTVEQSDSSSAIEEE